MRDSGRAEEDSLLAEAAAWHVQLQSEDVTPADRAAFEAWRSRDAEHDRAYVRIQNFWSRFEQLESRPALTALDRVLQEPSARPRKLKAPPGAALGVLLAALAGWWTLDGATGRYLLAEYRTPVGQQRQVELPDHSRITLNTFSAMDVDYDDHRRRIVLHQGEILVEVAKDAARPFVVETGHGTAMALGTRYLVRREAEATQVSVLESAVQACGVLQVGAQDGRCLTLHPGEGARLIDARRPAPVPVDVEAAASWVDGSLVVDNAPLAEVLQELERYRHGRIHLAANVQSLRVSGVIPVRDPDRALDLLAARLPIRIQRFPLLVVVTAHP